ncbi:MAG TPA: ABC transporter substrate-binding protein, partial [Bacillota bacterium]|nr:ABC transporter substrate-binding protein [Bacillota bacterium]
MRKKLLLLALVLLLSIASSAVKIEVWIVGWSNEHERTAENLIDREFTPITGIEVDILPLGWGDGDKVILAIISGDAPDIITSNVVELGIRGSLLDLKKTFGEEYDWLEAQLFPAITKQVHFEGTRFGLPQNVSVMNACYRTDILAEMGMEIPETWDDVRAMLPKLQANGRDAGFFYGSPSSNAIWGAYTLITQHGGNFFMPDGFTSAMDLPESIRGFVEYIELYTKHNMPKAGAGITQFRTGEWVMFIEGYWT